MIEHYGTAKSWKEVEGYLLSRDNLDAVVCESFEPFQGKRAVNQDKHMILTIEYIGRIKQWCSERKILCVMSSPTNKSTGYDISPVKKTSVKDDSHWRDAVAHGAHFVNLQRGHDIPRGFVLPHSQGRGTQPNLPGRRRSTVSRYK